MFQSASISLSGPAFSFLLYETCKGSVRQNGFLLGEIVHKEITSITDNEQKQVDISKIIKINSVMPCSSNNYFPKGRVDKDKLHKLLGSNFSKVVAWYKYEPASLLKFTLKDKALHKQFRELFTVPQDLFSVCFLSMDCTENFASYNYQQFFLRYLNGHIDRLSLYIPNLSESNNTYKNSEPESAVFNKILSSIKMDIETTKGVVAVTEIENTVQNYINKTAAELAKAEKTLFQLEEEIQVLNQHQKRTNIEKAKNEVDSVDDLITFDEPTTPDIFCNSENSPEMTRRSQRTRSKSNVNNSPVTDSNKREATIQNDVQNSPEAQRKSYTPKSKARGFSPLNWTTRKSGKSKEFPHVLSVQIH